MRLAQPDNRLYLGAGGSGKSTLARRHSWGFARVVIVDPNAEPEWGEGAIITDDFAELIEAARSPQFRVAYRVPAMSDPARTIEAYDEATKAAWAAGLDRDVCVIWDEADAYMPDHRLTPFAHGAWNQGRHRGMHIFAIARSPFALSPQLRRNTTALFAFAADEARDLDWYAAVIGRDAAAEIKALPRFSMIEHRRGSPWRRHDLKNS